MAAGMRGAAAGAQQLKTRRRGGKPSVSEKFGGEGEKILLKKLGHIDKSLLTKY